MNHKFCITGVSWRQIAMERSEVTYITPRREIKCYKKVCKSCTFYNRSTFFVIYFITSTLSYRLCITYSLLSYTSLSPTFPINLKSETMHKITLKGYSCL